MKAPWSGQLSAAKTGWLVMLLFFGWLGYLLVPVPKPEPASASAPAKRPPSRLVSLGLPDNPDLEYLPDLFALYAEQAEWKDGKAIFAYWNTYTSNYPYVFEATRTGDTYHFTSVDGSEFDESQDGDNSGEMEDVWRDTLPHGSKIRFHHSNMRTAEYHDGWVTESPGPPSGAKTLAPPRVLTELDRKKKIVPPSELKIPSVDIEQNRR